MSSRSFLEQGKLNPDTVCPWVGTVYNGFSMVKGKLKKIVSFDADACNQEQVVTYDERSNVLTIHQKHGETYLQIVYFSPYRLESVYFKTKMGGGNLLCGCVLHLLRLKKSRKACFSMSPAKIYRRKVSFAAEMRRLRKAT